MMTCKDCIHYETCEAFECCFFDKCSYFKDKLKFIELPCGFGSVVYVVYADEIQITSIYSIEIEPKRDHWIFICKCLVANGGSRFEKFIYNKTLFLSREEAEKALKERKNK